MIEQSRMKACVAIQRINRAIADAQGKIHAAEVRLAPNGAAVARLRTAAPKKSTQNSEEIDSEYVYQL